MSNVRISQLPTGSALTGSELVPVVQNGQTIQTTVGSITSSPTLTQTFVTVSNTSSLPNSRYFAVGTGIGLTDTGAQGQLRIDLNGTSASVISAGWDYRYRADGYLRRYNDNPCDHRRDIKSNQCK